MTTSCIRASVGAEVVCEQEEGHGQPQGVHSGSETNLDTMVPEYRQRPEGWPGART